MNVQTDDFKAEASHGQQFKQMNFFPTSIFSLEAADPVALNKATLEHINAERERDEKGIQRSNFRALGGWHSHNSLHQEAAFKPIVDLIYEATAGLEDANGYHDKHPLTIGTMWSIVNPPGSSNRAHIHPGCLWSGVYYVQAPENSGDIEFIDPRTQNLVSQAKYQPNKKRQKHCWTKLTFSPRAGRLLIFPSWLYHSVAPNLSTNEGKAGERIIISFNLSQSKAAKPKVAAASKAKGATVPA